MRTKWIEESLMSTQLPVHLASLEHRPIETPPARLSRRLSVILIGALSGDPLGDRTRGMGVRITRSRSPYKRRDRVRRTCARRPWERSGAGSHS